MCNTDFLFSELARPERVESIKAEHARRIFYETKAGQETLTEVFDDALEYSEIACAIYNV